MYPVNQVILGGDSMFNNLEDIDLQIQKMEAYRQRLKQLKDTNINNKLIWDEIDAEITPLSNEQKNRLSSNEEYITTYNEIQKIVQTELLNLVKSKIESSTIGKELLTKQLTLVRKLKNKIIQDTDMEMELFKKFKEYSKSHPEVTYDQFLKDNKIGRASCRERV